MRRIRARIWAPGDIIPSELDLAREFSCARGTINRALTELAEAGILERRRRAGTRVSLSPVHRATLDIPVIRREIEALGARYRHRLLARAQETAPEHLVAGMNLARGKTLLHLKALHLANDRPFVYEDRWINPESAPGIDTAPLDAISANEWLVRNAPISRGDIAFFAAGATTEDAAALNVVPQTPLFVIERLTWADSSAVTRVRLAYRPGYRMTADI
ncbi:MAG: GntR family transcriptional regulator [Paracoccaceae bacterium]